MHTLARQQSAQRGSVDLVAAYLQGEFLEGGRDVYTQVANLSPHRYRMRTARGAHGRRVDWQGA